MPSESAVTECEPRHFDHIVLICGGPSLEKHGVPRDPNGGIGYVCVNGAIAYAKREQLRVAAWVMVESAAGRVYRKHIDHTLAAWPECDFVLSEDLLKNCPAPTYDYPPDAIVFDQINPEFEAIFGRRQEPRTSGVCALASAIELYKPTRVTICGMDGYDHTKPLYTKGCGNRVSADPAMLDELSSYQMSDLALIRERYPYVEILHWGKEYMYSMPDANVTTEPSDPPAESDPDDEPEPESKPASDAGASSSEPAQ